MGFFSEISFRIRRSLHARMIGSLLILSVVIGVASGIVSIIFFELLKQVESFFLYNFLGFHLPDPKLTTFDDSWNPCNYLLPIITGLGGLISGFLVYGFAPEAEGHGTDAAIASFHRFAGKVRARVPLIKILASIFTIGTGGSAGREGPMAQIGSGVGSIVSDLIGLPTRIRRLAVAIGIGAGIGSIFKAPLGGAIFGVTVLYRHDFEVEALLPGFIAAIIGYTIFGFYDGFTPVFNMPRLFFNNPMELIFYVILGIVTGLFGILYVKVFYLVRHLFAIWRVPNYFKPAIGGLLTGLSGIILPHVIGMGYGWMTLFSRSVFPLYIHNLGWTLLSVYKDWLLLVGMLLMAAILKILATSFTIGSGGSGGVYAPGLFTGGSVGAALAILFINIFPSFILDIDAFIASFVIIGMLSLFGGVSKAPLAVLIMVSEMTGSYELVAPSMLAIAISYFITRGYTIYPEQLPDREHTPAHWRA